MLFVSRSEFVSYCKVLCFGLLLFGAFYLYTQYLNIPNVLNKSVADTSIILICFSMMLASLQYFFNFTLVSLQYRKHLGLIGFAFGIVHIFLSFSALKALMSPAIWQTQAVFAPLSGLLATGIFTMMTLISNRLMMTKLGVMRWRTLLRVGHLAVFFILAHVVFLKYLRWIAWGANRQSLPASSILVSIVMIFSLVLRIAMWVRKSRIV